LNIFSSTDIGAVVSKSSKLSIKKNFNSLLKATFNSDFFEDVVPVSVDLIDAEAEFSS
jgi:hypothetical protein